MRMISSTMRLRIIILVFVIVGCEGPKTDDVDERGLLPDSFPADFTPPIDADSGDPVSGWGGGWGEVTHTPIVFVHGNGHTAGNWTTMATYFAEDGYTWNELWAISYLGEAVSEDLFNTNEGNWEEIDQFVTAVLEYTQSEKVNIIAHSLGVTVSRTWLKYSNDYSQVENFVGIAGANHGVAFCGPNQHSGLCGEVGHPDSDFLQWLNEDDETPQSETLQYITVYNGAHLDVFFPANALMNDSTVHDLRTSPLLEGADNIQFANLDHISLATAGMVYDTLSHYINTQ
ncbi:alpha/beta fold hydrolase [bacterium]|nr:alpha/beta fold hydrolase [bacterium]